MAKRSDVKKILIIGSGPIIIGQACEFDYSGTQACKALKKLGYQVVLVNSNPATIMTDPSTADATYIEPLNVARLESIIAKERPDALLPNLGGQSGLNLCSALSEVGVLKKYGVEVLGVQVDSIKRGEDRIAFKEAMAALGCETAKSAPAYSVEEARSIALELGYPVVVRPAYTMGGAGSGLVYGEAELDTIAARGISASMIGQVLIEESILGWEELELEVVRDADNNLITVCFIENIDPIGVHTGDSFCAAPMLTISKALQDRLQAQAYRIVESIQVIGGTNVQFAHDPVSDRVVVIEINPRTSRSSALASKATGFPIAMVSAMLAAGLTLRDIPCGKCSTLDQYVPGGDYVVIKFARWAFEKFKGAHDELGTQMRAVGEVMSIGKTYKEAFQKAIRSLETGRYGLGFVKGISELSLDELEEKLKYPSSQRQFLLYEALKKGALPEKLAAMTGIKRFYLDEMLDLIFMERRIRAEGQNLGGELLREAKLDGFSDKYLAFLSGLSEKQIRDLRRAYGIAPAYSSVHVSGTEDARYYYSSYAGTNEEAQPGEKKIMVLGGGPNRIGQGIEFDYCCVHAARTLRALGFETIMVNCNPETVSTDYDASDKLYFEPLTLEEVLAIYEREKPLGVLTQFGGQTPLNLAAELETEGVRVLGTPTKAIDMAEDRDLFRAMMEQLKIPMPESGMAANAAQAKAVAASIGYPVMVRPSYVLGGRGMEIIYDEEALLRYVADSSEISAERPILIDRFLKNAVESEADAISDGERVCVPAIMEHIELAGIHSGDSACVLPPRSISAKAREIIYEYTRRIASALGVVGLMNIQYAIEDGRVYVLEANPRASRTVPLVSKICNIQMAALATEVIVSKCSGADSPLKRIHVPTIPYFGVKEAVLPFNMFPEVDPVLGPEMRSTGEVLGMADSFGEAYWKAEEATQTVLPLKGTVLFSVRNADKNAVTELARGFAALGFRIMATPGTCARLKKDGIEADPVNKLYESAPNVTEAIQSGQVQLLINTISDTTGKAHSGPMRRSAVQHGIGYISTLAGARAALEALQARLAGGGSPLRSLQEYHKLLR